MSIEFSNKSFVITGTFKEFERKEIEEIITSKGGVIKSSVSSKTDYLICGEKAGSKLNKANELGIKVITETELKSFLNNGDSKNNELVFSQEMIEKLQQNNLWNDEYISEFDENGLAIVKQNKKWGFIDKTGKVIIPLEYDNVDRFSDGLARVRKDEKWEYIDKTGKLFDFKTLEDLVILGTFNILDISERLEKQIRKKIITTSQNNIFDVLIKNGITNFSIDEEQIDYLGLRDMLLQFFSNYSGNLRCCDMDLWSKKYYIGVFPNTFDKDKIISELYLAKNLIDDEEANYIENIVTEKYIEFKEVHYEGVQPNFYGEVLTFEDEDITFHFRLGLKEKKEDYDISKKVYGNYISNLCKNKESFIYEYIELKHSNFAELEELSSKDLLNYLISCKFNLLEFLETIMNEIGYTDNCGDYKFETGSLFYKGREVLCLNDDLSDLEEALNEEDNNWEDDDEN